MFNPQPHSKNTIEALWKIEKIILDTLDFNQVVHKIVDSILVELGYLNLGYRIIVLILYDEKEQVLKRISLSQTTEARKLLEKTNIPFPKMDVPISATDNLCVKVFLESIPYNTTYWPDILCPPFSKNDAIKYQELVQIKASKIYPIISKGKCLGVLIFSLVKELNEVTEDEEDLIRSFTTVVGLAVQNAKLYTSLQTTSKRLEIVNKDLEKANEKLKALDKLKDDFLSIASHELRTPMTAIKSYLWMVLNRNADTLTPKNKEYLDRVYNSTERLINLVNEMLNVSRIESGKIMLKIEDFDMMPLIDDVKNEVTARMLERKQQLIIETCEKSVKVHADREKIHQVLENLVGNSIKFTPEGGKITINVLTDEKYAKIYVADTGKGISKEDFPKLFKKFGRLENSLESISQSSGTGLGLYICQQFVELCGGKISVAAEEGKGAKFIFTLALSSGKYVTKPPVLVAT